MADLGRLEVSPRSSAAEPARRVTHDAPARALSVDELRAAFVANLFDLFRSMAGLPGAELDESETLSRHCAFPVNPMFRGVWQASIDADALDERVEETIAWFRARESDFFFWWVDPASTPVDLGQRLEARGFTAWEEDAPGMATELDDLRYDLISRVPPGYTQERVTDEPGLRDFREAFVRGFEVPAWAGQAWYDATLSFGIIGAPWTCYVGRLDGEPVASNMLFCGAGVASVFGVATVESARGRGIGASITLAAYDDARRAGYRYGVLFGTELGVPVYHRIGFSDVDATVSRYLWRAD
jgi:GNAT superfamily N-acetyltransferase